MGILSRLKGKALKREEPAPISEDIKAHVVGEYPPPPSEFARAARGPPAQPPPEFTGGAPLPELPAPPEPLPRQPGAAPATSPPGVPLRHAEKGVEYEILDRMALMDAQLGAIRAQVETINERLKTMELTLGVRAQRAPARY